VDQMKSLEEINDRKMVNKSYYLNWTIETTWLLCPKIRK